jgi:hypothetical protein
MASRKEQKEALRRERLEREQAAAQAAQRKRLIGIVVAAVLVLGIVGALAVVVLAGGDDDDGGSGGGGGDGAAQVSYPDGGEIPDQKQADLKKAVAAAGCKTEEHQAEGSGQHTEDPVNYQTEPPALGAHNPAAVDDAIYEEAPPAEQVVHGLEHGRIAVWVRPDASEELLGQIKALYDEDPYHVIVVPRSELKEPVAVTAWQAPDNGRILRCPEPGDQMWDAIRAFKEQYRDKAPEFVP